MRIGSHIQTQPLWEQPESRAPASDTGSARRRTIADRFMLLLAIVLMGYACDGKGFAYIGIPPIFVGEIALMFGMLALLTTPRWLRMFSTTQALILLPFMGFGLLRTLPFVGTYGLDALR